MSKINKINKMIIEICMELLILLEGKICKIVLQHINIFL